METNLPPENKKPPLLFRRHVSFSWIAILLGVIIIAYGIGIAIHYGDKLGAPGGYLVMDIVSVGVYLILLSGAFRAIRWVLRKRGKFTQKRLWLFFFLAIGVGIGLLNLWGWYDTYKFNKKESIVPVVTLIEPRANAELTNPIHLSATASGINAFGLPQYVIKDAVGTDVLIHLGSEPQGNSLDVTLPPGSYTVQAGVNSTIEKPFVTTDPVTIQILPSPGPTVALTVTDGYKSRLQPFNAPKIPLVNGDTVPQQF
ncbi:MAG: hypothetical protein HY092_03150 [Candidatus Kerfeldbacteria bacterium]|nr:hypothetical protein [Candidatus Kerfeldbacteria bacterium]